MPLLIDTYNVLHTVGVLPPEFAGVDAAGLVALLRRSRYRRERLTLVCDGLPPAVDARQLPTDDPGVKVYFSGPGRPADDLIAEMIRASTAPRRLLVVSSDHAVLKAARKRRCRTLTSEQLLEQLANDAAASGEDAPRSPWKFTASVEDAQVERWMRLFAIDESVAAFEPDEAFAPREEATPEQPAAPAATGSASAADQAQVDVAAPPELSAIELPEDLVREAEQLWSSAAPRPPVSPPSQPATNEDRPAPREFHEGGGETDPESAPAGATDPDNAETTDELDMNAWLPDDGHTRPWNRTRE